MERKTGTAKKREAVRIGAAEVVVKRLVKRHTRDVLGRLVRVEAAVAGLTKARQDVVDFEDPEDVARYEAQRLRTAAVLLQREARSLASRGVIDEQGNRVKTDLPDDMREGSGCDL